MSGICNEKYWIDYEIKNDETGKISEKIEKFDK